MYVSFYNTVVIFFNLILPSSNNSHSLSSFGLNGWGLGRLISTCFSLPLLIKFGSFT